MAREKERKRKKKKVSSFQRGQMLRGLRVVRERRVGEEVPDVL